MPRLPPLQARHRLVPGGRARHLDQRHRAAAPACRAAGLARRRCSGGAARARSVRAPLGRLHPGRLADLLLVVRRPRRVRQPRRLVPGRQLQQPVQRPGRIVHRRPRVPDRGEPGGHGVDRERAGVARRHLVPAQRRGHPRVRHRAHRVRRRDRAVLGVLVVVDEDPVPFLLPPPGRGLLRRAALDLAGQRHRRAAHLAERPARHDPRVDVEAARPGRLRPAGQAVVGQHRPRHHGHVPDLRPLHPRHRVQVHPQLVGVVQVPGPHRVRVQVDAAEVDHPGQLGRVADHDLLGGAAGREAQLGGLDPVRALPRGALLEERLALGALHEALQRHRPAADAAQRARGHRQVIPHQVQLGVPGPREVDLLRVGDRHLPARHLDHGLRTRHVSKAPSVRNTQFFPRISDRL